MTRYRDSIVQKVNGRQNVVKVFVRITDKGNVFHIPAHRLRTKNPQAKGGWKAWAESFFQVGRAA